jgi:hypothetical protein
VCSTNSLLSIEPDISKDWHPSRNLGLLPSSVTTGSSKKVWWQCSHCGFEWEAAIKKRVHSRRCRSCRLQIPSVVIPQP